MAGKFIVLEGIEGVPLEGLAGALTTALMEKGLPRAQIHLTREPSDGPIGRDIRLALRGRLQLDARTLAVLFAADRLDHLRVEESGIEARLGREQWVICDRYYLSHYAFQTYQGFDLAWLRSLNQHCRRPDLIFYIELPIAACISNFIGQQRMRGFHYTLAPDAEKTDEVDAYLKAIQSHYQKVIEELKGEEPIVTIKAHTEKQALGKMLREIEQRRWL